MCVLCKTQVIAIAVGPLACHRSFMLSLLSVMRYCQDIVMQPVYIMLQNDY